MATLATTSLQLQQQQQNQNVKSILNEEFTLNENNNLNQKKRINSSSNQHLDSDRIEYELIDKPKNMSPTNNSNIHLSTIINNLQYGDILFKCSSVNYSSI